MPSRLTDTGEVARAVEEQRARLRELGLSEAWAQVGEVFADQYVRIIRDAVRYASGRTGTYLRIERAAGPAGGVIAVTLCGGCHVLVRHSRYATGRVHLEYPRGFAEDGETGPDTVTRELREETGIEAQSMACLGTIYADTGLLNMPIEVYSVLADTDNQTTGAELDIDEGLGELLFLTPADLKSKIAEGEIDDALTLAAFAMYEARAC